MAETQQTMTEFTYATGETGIVGDRFSPSVVLHVPSDYFSRRLVEH